MNSHGWKFLTKITDFLVFLSKTNLKLVGRFIVQIINSPPNKHQWTPVHILDFGEFLSVSMTQSR